MRILIVDDEFVSRKKAEIILSKLGQCDFATSGQEALDAVVRSYEEKHPYDLVTMDVMMPDMDGLEALKAIRAFEAKQEVIYGEGIKVLMLTASDKIRTVFASFFEGCEAYVVKPFDKRKLIAAMDDLGLPSDEIDRIRD